MKEQTFVKCIYSDGESFFFKNGIYPCTKVNNGYITLKSERGETDTIPLIGNIWKFEYHDPFEYPVEGTLIQNYSTLTEILTKLGIV